MSSYTNDQIADQFGGWARLCDPGFSPSVEVYTAFASVGLTKEEFDKIRSTESMPARQRAIFDLAETLLTTWSRYLCGYITLVHEKRARDRFVDLPLPWFWGTQEAILTEHEIAVYEIEDFIQAGIDQTPPSSSPYCESRMVHMKTLARLIRQYPPPDTGGPDLDPALVPLRPSPRSDGTAEALALPERDEMSDGT